MCSSDLKLQLTWTRTKGGPGRAPVLQLDIPEDSQGEDQGRQPLMAMLSACGRPRCGCSNVLVQWRPMTPKPGDKSGGPGCGFWFDLGTKAMDGTPEIGTETESRRLAGILGAGLTDSDVEQLRAWYLDEKFEHIRTTPVSEMDTSDLPKTEGGRMVGFVDVFPAGMTMSLHWKNEIWAVDDQYCVQPGCDCGETVLSFLKLKDATGQVAIQTNKPPAIHFNYRTKVFKLANPGPAGSPAATDLLTAFRQQHSPVKEKLQLRHSILQSVYAGELLNRLESDLPSTAAEPKITLPKIGRNDPCPCGSGRKYKQCCLIKPKS